MSNRSGIKYPRIYIRVSEEYICNINNKCMSSGSTFTTAILLQGRQVHLAVSLPVTFPLTMEALRIRSRSSSIRRRSTWLRAHLFISLALALPVLPEVALLLKVGLVLDSHHMAAASTFLDICLCCLKHATQLIQTPLGAMHMVVRDEVTIARWERRENEISGQLLPNWEAQLLQSLSVTNHLDYMWPNCSALC
jgi:hypothetical protein